MNAYIIAIYLIIVNLAAFCMYGIDKSAAIKGKQRIPNKVFIGLAVFGGAIGAWAGMYKFRHKTKKWYYTITIPVILLIQVTALVFLLTCCSGSGYERISQEEAMQLMQNESDYLIVDVRRADEYVEGHIPDAINIPNEDIGDEMPEVLPDKDQMLLIYCHSGNRSREASKKLANMGYTKVYDFGGINSWEGDIVTGE